MTETTGSHFGQWWGVVLWIVLYGVLLAFVPFYRRSQRRPASAYLAFVVAFALEMFGVPLSLYIVGWALGRTLPEGVFWGHTLVHSIGYWGMYIGGVLMAVGALLVILGWRVIHQRYWSRDRGEGELVTDGVYRYVRHPQYTGFLLVTLGMLCEWATLPTLVLWPIMVLIYYRLARHEEEDMVREFGAAYTTYRRRTGMFLPRLALSPVPPSPRARSR